MRILRVSFIVAIASSSLLAQAPPRGRMRPAVRTDAAEMAVKQAVEQLAAEKRVFERDIEVLRRLRAADGALADAMQPSTAIQKAYEEVDAARGLVPEFLVMQGVIRAHKELETARRSPTNADFGRLRSIVRDDAMGPAIRVAVRNALRLQEETVAWLRVQQSITDHVRALSEISGQSLRASE